MDLAKGVEFLGRWGWVAVLLLAVRFLYDIPPAEWAAHFIGKEGDAHLQMRVGWGIILLSISGLWFACALDQARIDQQRREQ